MKHCIFEPYLNPNREARLAQRTHKQTKKIKKGWRSLSLTPALLLFDLSCQLYFDGADVAWPAALFAFSSW
jgi:hypothetical protein